MTLTIGSAETGGWRALNFPGGGQLYSSFEPYLNLLVFLFGDLDRAEGFVRSPGAKDRVEMGGEARLWFVNGVKGELSWSEAEKKSGSIRINKGGHTEIPDPTAPALCTLSYGHVYDHYLLSLSNKLPSNLYQSMKTVETIEKIYKAALHKEV
jgi:hypothetical protein